MHRRSGALLLSFLLILSACTSVHPPSGFLKENEYEKLQKGKHFIQQYAAPEADFSRYEKVKVEPVSLKYYSSPYENYTQSEIDQLASKLRTALEIELSKNFQVVKGDQKDAKTLVVEPALVFVTSPERVLNLLTIFLIGFQLSKGAAAFEAKLVDGGSGKVIALMAENRKGGGGITDIASIVIGGVFRFIHAEGAFKRWGRELARIAAGPEPQTVS